MWLGVTVPYYGDRRADDNFEEDSTSDAGQVREWRWCVPPA